MSSTPSLSATIEPFFFGPAGRQLFGCYHPPAEPARDCGVVICHPVWREYIHSHRACMNLGHRLATAGFPCLRFDYYGSGDSAGDADEVDLGQWKADISRAIDELRDRAGVETICLAGLRFGATLAALVAAERRDIASLVLWDPAVQGDEYLADVLGEHEKIMMSFFVQPHDYVVGARPSQLQGFAVPPRLLDAVEATDLRTLARSGARDILIVESFADEPAQQLATHFGTLSARVSHQHIETFKIWTQHVHNGLVPSDVLRAIITWISKVHQ